MITFMQYLGQAVKHLRQRKNWTAGQLAAYSRVSKSYISQLEAGERGKRPGHETVEKLARALGVKTDTLKNWRPDEDHRLVVENWDALSESAIRTLVQVVMDDLEKSAASDSAGSVADVDEAIAQ